MRDPELIESPPSLARLGEFLRGRRLSLAPEHAGVKVTRKRRTPGLRREEVAALAGISLDWYTRIEVGTGAVPSVQTLVSIARALQLGDLDTRYLFEIAGLPIPRQQRPGAQAVSLVALEHAIINTRDTAAVMYDVYGSPLCWNAAADGLFRWSTYPDAFSRNMIVAGLNNAYYRDLFGKDFTTIARNVVGMFRRAYTTTDAPPLAHRVYEYAKTQPIFQEMWNEHSVSDEYTPPGPMLRYVPEVGELCLDYTDVVPAQNPTVIVRFIAPHDEATRAKLARLIELGKPGRLSDSAVQ